MVKKMIFCLIVLSISVKIVAMQEESNENSSSNEDDSLLSHYAGSSYYLKSDTYIAEVSQKLVKLRDHLIDDGGSYQTSEHIKAILLHLKTLYSPAVPADLKEALKEALEEHFDEIKAAAKIGTEYYSTIDVPDKKLYFQFSANALANRLKITRFCKRLQQEYDVFKNDVPLLK